MNAITHFEQHAMVTHTARNTPGIVDDDDDSEDAYPRLKRAEQHCPSQGDADVKPAKKDVSISVQEKRSPSKRQHMATTDEGIVDESDDSDFFPPGKSALV